MRSSLHAQLTAIARREAGSHMAEDVVQEALLIAVETGRLDLEDPEIGRWLCGVVRNRARMAARSARRRTNRESDWARSRPDPVVVADAAPGDVLAGLPKALRTLAALALTGHNRREIAYLLDLPDTALRQRISALKRHLVARGLATPRELCGLNLDLAYGRLRDRLLPALHRHGAVFASHDPDGHIFLVRRSQRPGARQWADVNTKES